MNRSFSAGRAAAIIAVIVMCAVATASARDGLYGSGGIGVGGSRLAVGLNLTYTFHSYVVSARGIMTDSDRKPQTWFTDHTEEFALMFGYGSRQTAEKLSATIEGGIGTISITRWKYSIRHTLFGDVLSADDKASKSVPGLAVQSQLYYWRFGVTLFGNLNREENVFGALACFRFGRAN